ncbi:tRNA-dihydrouridine(47) synthase [NAD(P)(+)]-like isoform X2 [Aristolochia californica]|uniref:tRNA-dihydrouridine(47) synthase [NAD(P)(+)]-like isoform X2 n=1 Tax=Aristolochia californica TaxID=171875 RepID=UPI0035E1F0C8
MDEPASTMKEPTAIDTLAISNHQTPEELVAKAIAPVKREYLRPTPIRSCSYDDNSKYGKSGKDSAASNVVTEKKSKRQQKRERKQEQKSVLHICPDVARSGTASTCRYGGTCRFSHDLEAYKAQKPEDLEGNCPFLSLNAPCPYGIACRFAGTHVESVSVENLKSSEMNGLKKDLQKLLWKNKKSFPRADIQLNELGLQVKDYIKERKKKAHEDIDQSNLNGENQHQNDNGVEIMSECTDKAGDFQDMCTEKESIEDTRLPDEAHPLKKAKTVADVKCCMTQRDDEGIVESEEAGFKDTISNDFCMMESDSSLKLNAREKKLIDFRGKLYLAPLTTVGNLPFRRVCKVLGADITCGEMAMCTNLLQGQASEWALLRRHSTENLFGVQICGAYPDTVARTVDLVESECSLDFIDINMGCPIDIVVNKGAGSSLLVKPMRMKNIIQAASRTMEKPLTVKVRTGFLEGRNRIDSLIADIGKWGANALTIHGRSRQQRHVSDCPELSTCMISRGALLKPWIFTEIKEQRHWDISSGERLSILKDFVHYGLEHWGSDTKGVETTRHFLLEWLSYTFRYVPVGLLDIIPQRLNWRPPSFYGRDDLETLMASDSAADWIRISEMLLGKVPSGFTFAPKHKSNAYDRAENG